ncbi:hypothetical protein BS329_20855 [Amycolatopsis coloradensis]|uniref:PLD phosphodiesterase domain-containing protein n=1 Tax=Amycolatopsis coloradensis TaxID=76021 RepID=A0A1R0KR11_9PSEU|nr:hypothetical protein BS329_20855 [Amycolatopsis coloradensis]
MVGYVHGRCCFNDIAAAIKTATSPEHRIYLTGWWLATDTWLLDRPPPPDRSAYLLSDLLAASRAQIRSMTWKPPFVKPPIPDNKPWVDFVNGLPHGAAIADAKLPGPQRTDGTSLCLGVHHQKIVVVVGESGTIAFLGGMDLNNTRLSNQGVEPLHDVHVRLTGPVAAQVLQTVRERWSDHPDAAGLEVAKFQADPKDPFRTAFPATPPVAAGVPTCTLARGEKVPDRQVLIGRTYAEMRKFSRPDVYAFAAAGEHTALNMVLDGIHKARRTIYLEDQYLTSRIIREELVKKVQEDGFQHLLILLCNSDAIANEEFPQLRIYRNEYRRDLLTADPSRSRWSMYALKPCPGPARRPFSGEYVHSKTWIFDDTYTITGSANCTDRSFTFDTEIVAGIGERGFVREGPDQFSMALRMNLWHKHLGVPHNLVRDWGAGLRRWKSPPPSAMVYDASQLENDPDTNTPFGTDADAVERSRRVFDTDGLK